MPHIYGYPENHESFDDKWNEINQTPAEPGWTMRARLVEKSERDNAVDLANLLNMACRQLFTNKKLNDTDLKKLAVWYGSRREVDKLAYINQCHQEVEKIKEDISKIIQLGGVASQTTNDKLNAANAKLVEARNSDSTKTSLY